MCNSRPPCNESLGVGYVSGFMELLVYRGANEPRNVTNTTPEITNPT